MQFKTTHIVSYLMHENKYEKKISYKLMVNFPILLGEDLKETCTKNHFKAYSS